MELKLQTLIFRIERYLIALPDPVGGFFRLIELWSQRAKQRHRLQELDDTMLQDIGISKEQAYEEARKPFWKK